MLPLLNRTVLYVIHLNISESPKVSENMPGTFMELPSQVSLSCIIFHLLLFTCRMHTSLKPNPSWSGLKKLKTFLVLTNPCINCNSLQPTMVYQVMGIKNNDFLSINISLENGSKWKALSGGNRQNSMQNISNLYSLCQDTGNRARRVCLKECSMFNAD